MKTSAVAPIDAGYSGITTSFLLLFALSELARTSKSSSNLWLMSETLLPARARKLVKSLSFRSISQYLDEFKQALVIAPHGEFTESEWVDRFYDNLPAARYRSLILDCKRRRVDNIRELMRLANEFDAIDRQLTRAHNHHC